MYGEFRNTNVVHKLGSSRQSKYRIVVEDGKGCLLLPNKGE